MDWAYGCGPGDGLAGKRPARRAAAGPVRYPDFAGRDRQHARFPTRIRDGIREGPNFAGHFTIVEIGCGTGCITAVIANLATGQVFRFPYRGYDGLGLTYSVTSNVIAAT